MNLRRKLSAIESQNVSSNERDGLNEMLVCVLARRDALFWPVRQWTSSLGTLEEMRRNVLGGRVGISAKASGRSDWLQASELRSELVAAGLVSAVRTRGGEVGGLLLTAQGEADARALVGPRLKTLGHPVTRAAFQKLVHYRDQTPCWIHGRFMSESFLWNRQLHGCPDEWEELTECLLPLLTSGFIHASFDSPGRSYYSLSCGTPGEYQSSCDVPPRTELPIPLESNLEADPALDDLYLATFESECLSLQGLPESNDLWIPVPASNWYPTNDGKWIDNFGPYKTTEGANENA